ncbi:Vi polysaccharide biosynthesis protein VipB/TviC [Candidatus Zixiibacteriota bacterium]|nr:Vi polysaccharide biosynthesis protein VipB/TviC [candidate division Zixibacteria bacterium]
MKYLITGGGGFIGSNIAHELLRRGDNVRVLDNFSTGRKINITDINDKIELMEGDIRDFWTVREAVDGVDYILHQAALPSVPRSVKNPLTSNSVNIDGTLNILEAAKQAKVKRVVMASSSSVYGDTPQLPKHESMFTDPLSPYAVTKLADEKYCKVFYELYGLETVALRYFNIFGPRQDPGSEYAAVIPKFINAFLAGKKPVVYGDGEQSRDFTFIANAVEANILATTAPKAAGKFYNIAAGGQYTLNQLIKSLQEIMGVDIEPSYQAPRRGDILHSFADIKRAEEDLGYRVKVDFESGLKKTVEWFAEKFQSRTPVGGIKIQ